jgi:hypothetical protein
MAMKKASKSWLFTKVSLVQATLEGLRVDLKLGLLGVSRAPAVASHLLAGKQGATTGGVAGFALEQRAVGALLTGCVLGVLDFGGVSGITQSCGLGVFLVHQGLCHGLLSCQGCTAQSHLHHEYATIGLLHKNSSEVAKNSDRTDINFKNAFALKSGALYLIDLLGIHCPSGMRCESGTIKA